MRAKIIIGMLILASINLAVSSMFAQDPEQYGTPFTGVPDSRDAVIYQVNMRCFSSARNFKAVEAKLNDIRALGVNVLYLMPVQPVGTDNKSVSSPYCLKDLKAVNSEFGNLTDLRNLVDSAHSKGMAVILDWVPNQTSWDHPWITANKDWYQQDANGNIISLDSYNDVAALNYNNTNMRQAMIEAMRYWVFTANIDGFRFDYASRTPYDFWVEVNTSLRSIANRNLLLFAEGDKTDTYTAGLDMNFSWKFFDIIKRIYNGSSTTLINEANTFDYDGASGNQQIVRWLTNHDIYANDGSPFIMFGGKNGTLAAFAVTAFMKSVPFIYNGMEVGNTAPLPFPFKTSVVNWEEDRSVTPEMTNILAMRNLSPAIRRGVLTNFSSTNVCAFKKLSGNDSAYVFINLRNAPKTFTLPASLANKTMYCALTGEAENFSTSIALDAYQYRVFITNGLVIKTDDISVSPDTIEIHGTGTVQLNAIVSPLNATHKSVYWQSANENLATVSSTGKVYGVSPGTTWVYARTLNSQVVDSCFVTTTGEAVSSVTLTSKAETIEAGTTKQLNYTILPAGATNKNVSWFSDNTAAAKVSATGVVTGIYKGKANIIVMTNDGKKTDTCTVSVEGGEGFTVYFYKPSNWGTAIKIYYWDPTPGGILPEVTWPGLAMTSIGNNWYEYYFRTISATNLIFNDAPIQTGNLFRDKDGWYKDDVWYDSKPEEVGVGTGIQKSSFRLYPNPVESGTITVELEKTNETAFAKLIDLQGRNVFKSKLSSVQNNFDVSDLQKGIYIVTVETKTGNFSQKLIRK